MFENHRWNPSFRAPVASAPAFAWLIRSFGICKSGLARVDSTSLEKGAVGPLMFGPFPEVWAGPCGMEEGSLTCWFALNTSEIYLTNC